MTDLEGAGAGAGEAGGAADLLTGGSAGDGGAAGAGGDAGAGGGDAGGGDGAAGGSGGAGGVVDEAFLAQFSAETPDGEKASLQDWIKASGIKDLNGLAQVARDNQRALRDSGRIKVPGDGATAEDLAAFRQAIGVPDSPEGYQLAPITDAEGNAVPLDSGLLGRLAAKAHEAGVPKPAYEALVNDFVQAQLEDFGAMESQHKADGKKWAESQGAKQAEMLAAVNRGQQQLGLSVKEVAEIRNAIGAPRALDVLAKLGQAVSEDMLLAGGGGQPFIMNGDQAQAEIDRMKGDPALVAKMTVAGTPENAKYNRLLNAAGEAANRRKAAGI